MKRHRVSTHGKHDETVLSSPPHFHSHPPFHPSLNFSGNTVIDTHRDVVLPLVVEDLA